MLDTNVLSEMFRKEINENVHAFMAKQEVSDLMIAVVSITELRYGALTHENPARGLTLQSKIDGFLNSIPDKNILVLDRAAVEICAQLMAESRASSPREKLADLQIAAIAMSRNIPVVTRNIKDFQHEGLRVINPWATP